MARPLACLRYELQAISNVGRLRGQSRRLDIAAVALSWLMAVGTGSEPFFVAASGASAALAGLVFVAMSINLDHILQTRGLHMSGFEAIMLLLVPLVLCLSVLVPAQGVAVYVAEAVVAGAAVVAIAIITARLMLAHGFLRRVVVIRLSSTVLTVAPLTAAALTAGAPATSFGWLGTAVIVSILNGCLIAWSLLVLNELDNPARTGGVR